MLAVFENIYFRSKPKGIAIFPKPDSRPRSPGSLGSRKTPVSGDTMETIIMSHDNILVSVQLILSIP